MTDEAEFHELAEVLDAMNSVEVPEIAIVPTDVSVQFKGETYIGSYVVEGDRVIVALVHDGKSWAHHRRIGAHQVAKELLTDLARIATA